MANLKTTYMGLELRNPLIVASSSLSMTIDGIRKCADAGAGAVVLKSMFEEQVLAEIESIEKQMDYPWHTEALEYVEGMKVALGPVQYLKLIEKAKKTVDIPVIASLNCVSPKIWVDYTRRIAGAGADAIELNISIMPSNPKREGTEIEGMYFDIVERVRSSVDIPIAVKMGPYFSSIASVAYGLYRRGVQALVLFNRFYQLDIDINTLRLAPGIRFSSSDEISLPLRWITLLAGRFEIDLAASTGVHDSAGVIKQLLAGATVVQLCSTLYLNGLETIGKILEELEGWMVKHGFDSVDDFRGKLSQMQSDNAELYERLQYIKALVGIE
ncbi:MAG: dihydroorotate dehydrogenase-like protein [bacterium]|nr:MAG: dihydroorotate dehydrogenase-like protein [bacterium]